MEKRGGAKKDEKTALVPLIEHVEEQKKARLYYECVRVCVCVYLCLGVA